MEMAKTFGKAGNLMQPSNAQASETGMHESLDAHKHAAHAHTARPIMIYQ